MWECINSYFIVSNSISGKQYSIPTSAREAFVFTSHLIGTALNLPNLRNWDLAQLLLFLLMFYIILTSLSFTACLGFSYGFELWLWPPVTRNFLYCNERDFLNWKTIADIVPIRAFICKSLGPTSGSRNILRKKTSSRWFFFLLLWECVGLQLLS